MNSPQPGAATPSAVRRAVRLGGTAVALSLFSATMWFAWLGWDHEYYLVDGVAQGPYRTWQVLGCGSSIVAGSVLAYLRVRGTGMIVVLAAAAVIGFAVPWALDAAATDDSGLWVVGLFLVVVGGGIGLVLVGAVSAAAAGARRRLHPAGPADRPR